jgi:hypothetical protein
MSAVTLSLLLIAAGAALFALGWRQLSRRKTLFQQQLEHWCQTNGAILDCFVERTGEFENGEIWKPRVRYAFDAGGRPFEGSLGRLSAPLEFGDRDSARRWAQSRQPGTIVPVWYDPDQPALNTLEMDAPGLASFPFVGVLGTILALTGVIVILFV